MHSYLKTLKQYADFNGRTGRKEFWAFVFININFSIAAAVLDVLLGLTFKNLPFGVFYILYSSVVLVPGLAVTVRRLHDVGKSGWMLLIALIPIVGGMWLLVLYLIDSNSDENIYGENPNKVLSNGFIANDSIGDTLILISVIWMIFNLFFSGISLTMISKSHYDFFSTLLYKTIRMYLNIIWMFLPLSIAFAVKNKSIQIALFIVGASYLIYELMPVFMQLLNALNKI